MRNDGQNMLKLLRNSRQDKDQPTAFMDSVKLMELMLYFPIGGHVRFYPEFQRDIVLQSLVIGYGINDYVVYSHNDIRGQFEGNRHTVLLNDGGKTIALPRIESFCFLLPQIDGIENSLDYDRRAALGSGGPFRAGNTITMLSLHVDRGAPQIDATVRRRTVLNDGYYAGQEIAVLDILPKTFAIIDRREQQRLMTRVPVTLRFATREESYPCTLLDLSRQSLRVVYDDRQTGDLIQPNQEVVITVGLGNQPKTFILSGKVYRKLDDGCVISLENILKGSRFVAIDRLDALEITSNLLQHPETMKLLKQHQDKL